MEPNKFERQVQQKLEEFKIPPAEDVWTKVEKGINSKRKDRRILLLFAFLFLLLSAGFWYFKGQNISFPVNKQIVQNYNSAGNEAAKIKKQDEASDNSSEQKKQTMTLNKEEIRNKKTITKSSSSKRILGNAESAKIHSLHKSNLTNAESISAPADENKVFETLKKINGAWPVNNRNPDLQKPDTLNQRPSVAFSGKKKTVRLHHSWKFGISASAGDSWIKNTASHSYAPMLYTPSASFAGGLFLNRFYDPGVPPFKNSFSFSAGVYAERDISKLFDVNAGLSYQHLSLQNNVQNNFDFIEAPIQVSFQLIKNRHLPVTIDAGITPAYLAGSNALQYNYSGNSWYRQNDLFNKFQANLQTGFSVSVFNRYQHPLRLGPQFSYGLMKLADKGLYGGKHVHVLGIHAEMMMLKKK